MSTEHLFETVVRGGFCIGCGACAALPGSSIAISYTDIGTYQATLRPLGSDPITDAEPTCPFSDLSVDEDKLAAELFPDATPHAQIGRYLATYAGFVAEGEYRSQGSSGGLGTWLAAQLLESGTVDGVAHVRPQEPTDADERLFAYAISRDSDSLRAGAKSRYYPVEMSGVLTEMAARPGRYAVVGVPCFIKAIRLLQRQHPVFAERIVFAIGLVCGHLKSAAFAQSLSWQMGIHPTAIEAIDFRHKLLDRPANRYGVRIWSRDGAAPITKPTTELFGCDWGLGLFKYQACDYCDDVLAETADVAVGDAWLPQYVADSRGTNIVVARNRTLAGILLAGSKSGALQLSELTPDMVARSQAAGLRHRREGLSYRISTCANTARWSPPKRVQGSHHTARQHIYGLRAALPPLSHSAFREALQNNDLSHFQRRIDPLINQYTQAYGKSRIPPSFSSRLYSLLSQCGSALRRIYSRC